MGSLPNLRSLSNDPNTTYKYELCDPDESNPSSIPNTGHKFVKFHNRFSTNSQTEICRLRINQLPNLNGIIFSKNHHRACHTRSSGSQYTYQMQNFGDEFMVQLSANSPISNRSSRFNVTSGFHTTSCNLHHSFNRRKDSLSSSGGASSVRRLIAVVRSTPSRFGPIYSRKVLCRNYAALCLGHFSITAALLPLISLQSSVSTWWWPHHQSTTVDIKQLQQSSDVGSLLLCGSFAVGSLFTLLSPNIIHLIGYNWTLVCGYVCASAFFAAHLYPTIRCLVPAYLLLGICMGPLNSARISYLIILANKLTYVMTEEEEIHEQINGKAKENIVQKLFRGLQASQDLGMVLGNVVTWCFLYFFQNIEQEKMVLKTLFNEDETGEWICGSRSDPFFEPSNNYYDILSNATWYDAMVVSCKTTSMLASVFVGCGIFAVALTAVFTCKIRLFLYQDPLDKPHDVAVFQAVKNAFKDTNLLFTAPMSISIGLNQGFIHADFSKWYVVCSLGVSNISLVFLSMGLLQSIAAFTLSLLLQNISRSLVIAVGCIFHTCLILVLLLWKPSGDDSALFYVIAAAWGVCNIIWETLNFNLQLDIYPNSTWQIVLVHGNFFKFLGMSLAFGAHGILYTWVKLYILAIFMLVGMVLNVMLEIKLESKKKMKSALTTL